MNKLKDAFYDKNDILVVFIIIAIAAVVIFFRIDAIMDYPSTLVAESDQSGGAVVHTPSDDENDPGVISEGGITGDGEGDLTSPGSISTSEGGILDSDEVDMYSVYINYGESIQVIAQKFVDVGLFESVEQFVTLVEEKGVATQIKAGNFIMPSNSTPEEVIDYIIKPGL